MGVSLSQKRMEENEVVFRAHNERVRKNFEAMLQDAKETGQEYLIQNDDTPLHFYCECSDENCRQRILVEPSVYNKIHKNRQRFILVTGHETKIIERVVRQEENYNVVEKYRKPPESVRTLHPTSVDNT